MKKTFISYSSKDIAFVEKLANDLSNAGVDVWWDVSDIKGGDVWVEKIAKGIEDSDFCIVVLSPNSVKSEWVSKECRYASNSGVKIIPILYKPCKIPVWLADIHYIEFKDDYSLQLQAVLDVLNDDSTLIWANIQRQATHRESHKGYRKVNIKLLLIILFITLASFYVIHKVMVNRFYSNCKIAFVSKRSGNPEIFSMDIDGGYLRKLTNNTEDDWAPSWSPNGKKIVFVSYRGSPNANLFIMDADGSNVRQITDLPLDEHYPSWSPDSKKIAFTYGPDLYRNIYVLDIKSMEIKNITNDEADSLAPSWSPDSKKLVYHSSKDLFGRDDSINDDYNIFSKNSDGSGTEKQLTTDISVDSFPRWSPDGRSISFVSDRLGYDAIFVKSIEGDEQKPKPLTKNNDSNQTPSWSHDGMNIAFTSLFGVEENTLDKREYEIYSIGVYGDQLNRLTNNLARDVYPSWSPSCKGPNEIDQIIRMFLEKHSFLK